MNTLFIGQKIIRLESTDSTNSQLTRLSAEEKLSEGTVVVTQKQEQGKGQRGTIWESDEGKNLTLSILLHPTFLKPDEQFLLSKVVSLGVMDFIRLCVSPFLRFSASGKETEKGRMGEAETVLIKWPNDIYIGDKKVAGILIENSVSGNFLSHSVVGIGINVNQEKFSAELPNATSLKMIFEKEFDLEECLSRLCSCIERRYLQLKANHFEKINEDYLQNLYRFEEWANYKYKGEILKAKISGITKIGKLVLFVGLLSEEKENGEILECDFKEVEFY